MNLEIFAAKYYEKKKIIKLKDSHGGCRIHRMKFIAFRVGAFNCRIPSPSSSVRTSQTTVNHAYFLCIHRVRVSFYSTFHFITTAGAATYYILRL